MYVSATLDQGWIEKSCVGLKWSGSKLDVELTRVADMPG